MKSRKRKMSRNSRNRRKMSRRKIKIVGRGKGGVESVGAGGK
jgi:hypothetical protein